MFRFKTLFGRLITTYLIIVFITTLLLSFLTTRMLRVYNIREETQALSESAAAIDQLLREDYESGGFGEQPIQEISRLAEYEKYNVWMIDNYRIVYIDVTGNPELSAYSDLLRQHTDHMLDMVLEGETISMVSYDSDLYEAPIISVGVPLKLGGDSVGKEARLNGGVFLHTRLTDLQNSLGIFYSQLAISAIISVAISVILVFLTARQIERPLYRINLAARELGKGNFSKRIDVRECNEVGGLAETFNRMAEELEKYENTRRSFVANVSHELKSPLTSIQGFVQGILDNTIEEKDREQYLNIVLSETRRLNLLIGDLLDLAKMESGQFPFNKTEWDINELIRRCLIGFVAKIEKRSLEVAVNIPDEKTAVFADQDRITQVITNLMDNAVKFCEEGGTLKIWTYMADGKVHVNISNTGKAIPEEDIPFVFDRFFKVDKSHTRKAPGTGIGLSIVKSIILQHEEKIWVNSKEGTGTVFTFTLGLAPRKDKKKTPQS